MTLEIVAGRRISGIENRIFGGSGAPVIYSDATGLVDKQAQRHVSAL